MFAGRYGVDGRIGNADRGVSFPDVASFVDYLYCIVCLREILLHKKFQNIEEIQGGHCPWSKNQGGQLTTLTRPCRAPE